MFTNSLKFVDRTFIEVSSRKEVSCIEYTDGTCDLCLDLPNDLIALIFEKAADKNITVDEAATELVTEALENYLDKHKSFLQSSPLTKEEETFLNEINE